MCQFTIEVSDLVQIHHEPPGLGVEHPRYGIAMIRLICIHYSRHGVVEVLLEDAHPVEEHGI